MGKKSTLVAEYMGHTVRVCESIYIHLINAKENEQKMMAEFDKYMESN